MAHKNNNTRIAAINAAIAYWDLFNAPPPPERMIGTAERILEWITKEEEKKDPIIKVSFGKTHVHIFTDGKIEDKEFHFQQVKEAFGRSTTLSDMFQRISPTEIKKEGSFTEPVAGKVERREGLTWGQAKLWIPDGKKVHRKVWNPGVWALGSEKVMSGGESIEWNSSLVDQGATDWVVEDFPAYKFGDGPKWEDLQKEYEHIDGPYKSIWQFLEENFIVPIRVFK